MTFIARLDESGSLPDPAQPVVVVAALVVEATALGSLRPVLPRIRKRLNQRRKRGKKVTEEFKFETLCGHREFRTVGRVLAAIRRSSCKRVIVRVNKGNREIQDDPINYAILIGETVRRCRNNFPHVQFVFDRHYLASEFDKMQTVNHTLAQLVGEPLDILHKDSQDRAYPGLGLVDFVAGTVRFLATAHAHQAGYLALKQGMDALADVIVQEETIDWPDLKAQAWSRTEKTNR